MLSIKFQLERELLKQIFRQLSSPELHGSHRYDQIVVEKFHCLVNHVHSAFGSSYSKYWPDIMEMKSRCRIIQCFAISRYPISFRGSGRINVSSYRSIKR